MGGGGYAHAENVDLHVVASKAKPKEHYDAAGGGKLMTKNIYALNERVNREIKNNIIRPENLANSFDADDLNERDAAEKEMHNRFLELYGDYFSTRFRDAYGGSENFDPSCNQPEKSQKFGEHLVNRIMAENFIKKEVAGNKIIRKKKRNDCEKV